MERETIDQTASELALHRVLYVIKFLRAMVLHLVLAAMAVPLFFAGFHDAYPVASALIGTLIVKMYASERQHMPGGAIAIFIGFVLAFAAVLALLVWMYRSITGVRKTALRIQAALLAAVCLLGMFEVPPLLRFAFQHTPILFAIVATASLAMTTVIYPGAVILAL